MNVRDLMTTDVVTVDPETSLKDVATLLVTLGLSGVPVCDREQRVVGVISEQDILFKELGPAEHGAGQRAWLVARRPVEAVKARARTAADAMTMPAVTIGASRPVAAAARMMVERNVHRLPVVDADGALVGIVTPADLVRAFARDDREIAREIEVQVLGHALWLPEGTVSVEVRDGEVTLDGIVDSRLTAEFLPQLVRSVPGVVGVRSELEWRDDSPRRRRRALLAAAR